MTLTFKLDLDILPFDLHTEIQVCMSDRLAMRVVTHRHTHTHTDNVKTIIPGTSQTWGVMIFHSPLHRIHLIHLIPHPVC